MYWKQVAVESFREKKKYDERENRSQADQTDKLLGNELQDKDTGIVLNPEKQFRKEAT